MDKNIKNIIFKIRNLSFKDVIGNLLFVAIFSLIYRIGNFYNTFIPKPFELILFVVLILTVIYILKGKKFNEFFDSVSKKIFIIVLLLFVSVIIGWIFSLVSIKIPITINSILEFGTFTISLVVFTLILFYTKNNKTFFKSYFYALLLPVFYIIFLIFQSLAVKLQFVVGSNFDGLTMNVNVFSKTLLIPAMFFLVHSLFEVRNKWLKILYIVLSSALFALLLWTGSRGSILAFFIGTLFLYIVFTVHKFNWKKLLLNGFIIFLIFLLGFTMSSKYLNQAFINRIFNTESIQFAQKVFHKESIFEDSKIFHEQNFIKESKPKERAIILETRLLIWPFYLKQIIKNPVGIGPNTHFPFDNYFVTSYGQKLNNGPHNTYLQIWLWGGYLALFSFLYLIWLGFKNLKNKLKINFQPEGLVLLGSLFAVAFSIMFDDSLSCYWFFIILALSLRYENVTDSEYNSPNI